ncbi:MAG: secretin N-terminal domain-containing protein [Phycisphaerales bacterium]
MQTRTFQILIAASALACTMVVHADDAAPATPPAAPAPTPAPPAPTADTALADAPPPSSGGIRFAFKGQSWDQILDYFSRTTGLPVVRETEVPKGTVDFLSKRTYTLPEALTTLNQLLQTQNVMLRVERDKLYLQQLKEMKRENIPTFVNELPTSVTDDTIVTLMLPLHNARVGAIAPKLGELVGAYGSVTPLETQNTLIMVETAGQIRRMLRLIDSIDRAEPDAEVRFFPLKYAKANTLLGSLSSLVGQRQVEYVIGPDGKKTKIEESRMEGLSMTADERTNAIVARGARPRLMQLADVIELLDVPGTGAGAAAVPGAPAPVVRSVRTVMLRGVTPSEAKTRLEELYATLPKEVKPTVLAMDEVGKLAIVGPAQSVAEGAALIEALDGERRTPGIKPDDEDPHAVVLIPLRNADAASLIPQIRNLQTPAQSKVVVIAPGPDGRSIVVSSLQSEADQVRRIVDILDQAGRMERRTQVLKIQSALPDQALATARRIFDAGRDARNPADSVEIETGADGRTLTVQGTQSAIARFGEALRTAEQATIVERTTQGFDLRYATPSRVAPALTQMARQILAPKDGSQFTEPQIEPLDALRQVRVTATAAQLKQIATLVETLDRAERTGRMIPVRQAKAAELAQPVRDLVAKTQVDDPSRPFVAPTIDAIDQTNALWVVGEPAQLQAVEAIVRELDTVAPSQLPPLRLLQVRAADAAQMAQLLSQRYDQRPAEVRREKPVRVEADAATNTLIVTAHEDVFPEIREFVEGVNRSGEKEGKRETVIIPLRTGKAAEVAAALDKLYPQPPVPMDARGRPLPHLQKQKEIFVTADVATNTVIVECPAERKTQFEQLVAQLDRIEPAPQAQVRTWRLDRGDPEKIAASVRALAASGALTTPGTGGRKAPEVTVQVEAASRTLIVTGDEAAFEKVDTVLKDLQGVPQTGLKTYVLRSGRTDQVSSLLKQVLASRAKRELPNGESLVDVTADRRTGTLIVSAPESLMAVADQLVAQLDAAPAVAGGDTQQVRVHALTFADAGQIAPALTQAVAAMPSPVTNDPMKVSIVPATGSNALILTGLAPDIDAVEKLIEPLDKNGAADTAQVKTIVLKHARAETLAPLVEKLLADRAVMSMRDMPQSLRQEYMRRGLDRAPVRVAADQRLNAVVVSGPSAVVEVADQMVAQLDVEPTPMGGGQTVRVTTLRNAEAAEIAQTIGTMFANDGSGLPPPTVTVNASANTLVVRATDAQHAQIDAVVRKVDAAAAASGREMRTVALDPSRGDAAELARMLERTLNRQGRASTEVISVDELLKRAQGQGGTTGAPANAPANAPAPSNPAPAATPAPTPAPAATPSAAPATPPATPPAPGAQGSARRVPTGAALLLAAAFAQTPAAAAPPAATPAPPPATPAATDDDGSPDDPVTIAVDPATNSLVILGSKRAVERAQRLAQQTQAMLPPSGSVVRIVHLPAGADPAALRDVVLQTVSVLAPAGGRPGDLARRVAIIADPAGGTLVVAAPERDIEQVLDATAKIVASAKQAEPALKPVLRTFALKQSRASRLAVTLAQLFGSRKGANPLNTPQFNADERTNTLMVTAAPSALAEIETLVNQLDTAAPANDTKVQAFTLSNVLADDVTWTLRQLVAARGDAQGLRVDSDRANNRLLVAGTAEQLATAEQILKELDRPSEIQRTTEFIPLQHAEAQKIREALGYFYGPDAVDAETPGRRAVRIVTDPATNSLVVSAPKEEWAGLRSMLAKLDSEEYDASLQLRVYPMRHAQASSVATAINTAFKGDAQERQQAIPVGPDGRPMRQAPSYLVKNESWVSAVADPITNTVIVSASRQNQRKIESIVKQLDGEQVAELPEPRLIRVKEGQSATQLANALRTVFAPDAQQKGVRAPRMVPDEATGTIIIRAEDADFQAMNALAEKLQELRPEASGSLFMHELKHLSADAAAATVNGLGLTSPGATDPKGRVVRGAVKVFAVPGRNALAIAALPEDRALVADLVKEIDTEPTWAQAEGELVRLKHASATAVAGSLQKMLDSAAAPGSNALAKALQEQVRRLRVHRDGLLTPDLTLDLTKPVKLVPDEKTNSIMVTGAKENVAAARELVAMLDDVPLTEAVTMRIMPLENIEAQDFARVVRELFQQGKALGKTPGQAVEGVPEGDVGRALLDSVAITVIDRTNTVVVAGREATVALVEAMQQRLDSAKQTGTVEPQLVQLRYADAKELAATLDAVLVQGQAGAPAAGPMQKQVARLRMLAAREEGKPEVLESDIFTPMGRTLIRAEESLNALIVVSTPANIATIRELVRMLDVEQASPAASVRTYPLQRAGATAVTQRLQSFFEAQAQAKAIRPEDRVRILPDERTNSIVVSTSSRSFAILEELLKQLDREIPADLRELKLVSLEHASATRVAPLVQQLMDSRLDRLRAVEPRAADLQKVTVLADERSNTLLVSGGADSFDVIKGIVAQLDKLDSAEVAPLHVLPMKRGNLDRVATAVNQIMERRYADMPATVSKRARPLVMTDPRSNCLLIAATEADFDDIKGLVARIEEQPTDPAVALHVIPVTGIRVETIAPRLQTVMRERMQTLGETARPSDRISIEADLATNTLIVAASQENAEIINSLIDSLKAAGQESAGGREFEMVQLRKSRASDIVGMLDNMYIREENRRRGNDSVRAIADARTNAVILSGAAADITTLRKLLDDLEAAKPQEVVEIKYVTLKNANVLELISLVDSVLSGNSLGARGTQQATVVRYLKQIPGADIESREMEINAAVRQSISLTPDIRSNTVVVRAPREAMALVEKMISDLDRDDSSAQNVRIIRLTHAEAESVLEVLNQLFRLNRQGNLYVLKPREAPGDGGGAAGGAAGGDGAAGGGRSTTIAGLELNMVPDSRQELAITVDSRTNSLLVSGTPNYLNAVERVVKELDSENFGSRDQHIYRLKNAAATEVAATLTRFAEGERQKLLEAYGSNRSAAAGRLLDTQVTVVGDQKSNSVLMTGNPQYVEKLKGLIKELDVDPPQVLIQVMLAEVTLENTEELGLEFARVNVGNGYYGAGGFGLDKGSFGATAPKVPGLLGLAPALFTGVGVPNIAIGGPDFDLLINALASQNRVQMLSNPSVMVANNTEGRIQVGQTIRVPDAVTVSAAGQQSAVRPEEVGVILSVTPSINPDGFVKMAVEPEISRLSKQTVDISENFRSPVIERRRANTTVTVRDGETVVIGGLINDRYERTDRKVPLLGDIPIIGLAFRQKSEATSKTELLIVLRPHVVRSPARVQEVTEDAINRMTLQPGLKDQIRKAELKGMQGKFNDKGELVDPLGAPSEPPEVDGDPRVAPASAPASPGPAPAGSSPAPAPEAPPPPTVRSASPSAGSGAPPSGAAPPTPPAAPSPSSPASSAAPPGTTPATPTPEYLRR